MKTLPNLALLLSLSPLASGCMAPTSDESTQSTESSLINRGNSDPVRSEDDLKKDHWICESIDGVDVCTKGGTSTTYYCRPTGICTAGIAVAKPPNHGTVEAHPVKGPVDSHQ